MRPQLVYDNDLAIFKYRPRALTVDRALELCMRGFVDLDAAERLFEDIDFDPEFEIVILMNLRHLSIIGIKSNGKYRITE